MIGTIEVSVLETQLKSLIEQRRQTHEKMLQILGAINVVEHLISQAKEAPPIPETEVMTNGK